MIEINLTKLELDTLNQFINFYIENCKSEQHNLFKEEIIENIRVKFYKAVNEFYIKCK